MSQHGLSRRTALLAAAGCLVQRTARAAAAAPPARPAAAFIDSVGVCAHLTLEPYKSRYPQFRSLLAESGIRHIREEMRAGTDAVRWRDLHAGLGVRFQLLVSPATNTAAQMMAFIDALGPGVVSTVEGQNEGDSEWFKKLPLVQGDWAGTTVRYQREIYQAVRRRFSADQMPVVSPTLIDFKPRDTPLIRDAAEYCDLVGLHSYVQHAQEPETGDFAAAMSWYVKNFRDPFKPGAPMMVTEMGYTNVPGPNGNGVSEYAASVYIPRLLLNNFQLGMIRTFLYEFMDDGFDTRNNEHNFGMVRADGTPKPAYRTVTALMKALDPGTARGNPAGSAIPAAFPDAPADLRQQSFTRHDGTTVIALWRPLRVWDVAAGQDMAPASTPITMQIGPGIVWRSLVLDGTSAWTNPQPGTAQVPASAHVTLVQLTNRG